MGVVAITPFMLLVDLRTERSLVSVQHELLQGQDPLKVVQIHCESLISHQLSNLHTFFSVYICMFTP